MVKPNPRAPVPRPLHRRPTVPLRTMLAAAQVGGLVGTSAAALPRLAAAQSHAATLHDHTSHDGRRGIHGMILTGRGHSLLLSHIPMSLPPHDMQVVLKASFRDLVLRAKRFEATLTTFKPDPFSLDDVVDGRLKTIRGTLFAGNFELGGTAIAHQVEVDVSAVLSAAPLKEGTPADAALRYQPFVIAGRVVLIHQLKAPTDFDQVVAVKISPPRAQLAGQTLVISGRANRIETRLKDGDVVQGTLEPSGKPVTVTATKSLSTLKGPDFTQPPETNERGG